VNGGAGSIYASLAVLMGTYAAISIVRRHRTIAAIAGATGMIIVGTGFSFYKLSEVIRAVDFDAVATILGMMIIANLFEKTGLLQYAAIKGAKLARGKPSLLFIYLSLSIFAVSMIFDNTTTILIAIPLTVSLTDILGIPALPFLIGGVLVAQIGGMSTLIGSPANIIVGSAAGFSFRDFLTHLAPIGIIGCGAGLVSSLFHREFRVRPSNVDRLLAMDERGAITDRRGGRLLLLVLAGTILLFLVHDVIGLSPGIVAMIGAAAALLAVRRDFDATLKEIRWDTLLFFISLFIVVGGFRESGGVSGLNTSLAGLSGEGVYPVALFILWGSALISSVIGPVPLAIAAVPILTGIGAPLSSHLLRALLVGLGAGAVFLPIRGERGGELTRLFRSIDTPIPAGRWIRRALPVGLFICAIGSLALYLRLL